ncbi:porphobilinogen synthase [Streptomyces sp. NBRC 110465]|uniref:porphobilinogen synthase n=1 Tax=Streptomyces sp. NBRC 110465 TaxID=1897621 RepID=UPI000A9403FA|nr:porphobilinogen synthase [Streptomyces sp. NBRC 110465]
MTTTTEPAAPLPPDGINPGRARRVVRDLYARPSLTSADLSAPLLALPDEARGTSGLLPGAVPVGEVRAAVDRWAQLGIRGVKIFAYGHDRDARGTAALALGNRMLLTIMAAKAAAPGTAVTTEVCGCSWTDHGECVVRTAEGAIDLDATYGLMARMAVQHADAGADVVSPTAMLDGSVRAVRDALDNAGHWDVGVNPNVAIHTGLYGPFKALMDTDPRAGHRRGLQLEPGRADRDALIQAEQWRREGADSLTLQPVLTAVDVLVKLRSEQAVPLVAYSTSGELEALTALGVAGTVEYLAMLKRAGADQILTFAAESAARHLEATRA